MTRSEKGRETEMVVVTTFYRLYQKLAYPPSAQEIALETGLTRWIVYYHLKLAVTHGYLAHRMELGREWGVRGFRVFHPIKSVVNGNDSKPLPQNPSSTTTSQPIPSVPSESTAT